MLLRDRVWAMRPCPGRAKDTVGRAQQTYLKVREEFGDQTRALLHARLTARETRRPRPADPEPAGACRFR